MNKQEARLLLQCHRPGSRDERDPALREALALLKGDPELASWFERECELDRAIGARLASCPVPSDLRESIVAGQRSQRWAEPVSGPRWRSQGLAWAAAIALLLAAAVIFNDGTDGHVGLAAYRNAMTEKLRSGFVFDVRDSNPLRLQEWLSRQEELDDVLIPAGLNQAIGCKVFQYEHLKSALICFTLPDREIVHLFVVDGSSFRAEDFVPRNCSSFCNNYNTVAWREGERVYLLAGGVEPHRLIQLAGMSPD